MCPLPRRAYQWKGPADSWRDWEETGPYADRIGELLDQASSHAIFLGWEIHSRFPMADASGRIETLLEKLVRLCDRQPKFHAYLLLWDHASFYIALREKFQRRRWTGLHPRIHFVFDPKLPWGASHHEKIVLIDGIHGFCGGIDLCNKRRDYPEHNWSDPRRSLDQKHERHGPYHDRAVEVRGDIVEIRVIF
jgi:phosphatidylserine/phosphatidylglycerophosphate/cardiolipin synthase-like enzyme